MHEGTTSVPGIEYAIAENLRTKLQMWKTQWNT